MGLPQPKHDICPGDGQPCWTDAGGWRCGTSQCGRKLADQKVPTRVVGHVRKGRQRLEVRERVDEPSWVDPRTRHWDD